MGTTRRFNRTPDDRKRLTLDIPMGDGRDVSFVFNTRITKETARQVQAAQEDGSVDALDGFLKSRIVSTNTENDPTSDFDGLDLDVPEMRDLLDQILANGGLSEGESEPSSTPSSDAEGNSPSTSNTSTGSTSTTNSTEPIATGSFT